ncbi:hypothetical protein E4T47_05480, partial [Aureobasidium subglaciale]
SSVIIIQQDIRNFDHLVKTCTFVRLQAVARNVSRACLDGITKRVRKLMETSQYTSDLISTVVNIHSHTLGAVLFALLPFHFLYTLYQHVETAQPIDAIVFTLYFLGVAICFTCSAGCHIVWSHSPPIASLGNRLDFSGCQSRFHSFRFHLRLLATYSTLDLGVCKRFWMCGVYYVSSVFIKPAFRAFRAAMYASFGLFAVVFVLHGVCLYGFAVQRRRLAVEWMVVMALLNFTGAAFYALRFPEAWFPRRFDFLGASHQIFHVLVLAAGLVHYKGLATAFVEVRGLQHTCGSISITQG